MTSLRSHGQSRAELRFRPSATRTLAAHTRKSRGEEQREPNREAATSSPSEAPKEGVRKLNHREQPFSFTVASGHAPSNVTPSETLSSQIILKSLK